MLVKNKNEHESNLDQGVAFKYYQDNSELHAILDFKRYNTY